MPIQIVRDVPYARAIGYWSDNPAKDKDIAAQLRMFPKTSKRRELELTMDIYRPQDEEKHPLIMLIHGGAYYANNKESEPVASLCRDLAQCGYVCASINYRMGYHLTRASVQRAKKEAAEDAANALEFLIRKSGEYGIDSSVIFIGGASSGAIAAISLACKATLPSGAPLPEIRGIIDMWGGVTDLEQLDTSDAALLAIHGSEDKTVPYDEGYPLGGRMLGYVYGSKPLVARQLELNKKARLVTLDGYKHAPYRNKDFSFNENYEIILAEIFDFCTVMGGPRVCENQASL